MQINFKYVLIIVLMFKIQFINNFQSQLQSIIYNCIMKRSLHAQQETSKAGNKKIKKDDGRIVNLSSAQEDFNVEEQMVIRFTEGKIAQKSTKQKIAPWMSQRTRQIKDSLLRLHNQIIQFYQYVCPTEEEHQMKEKAIAEITDLIQGAVPDCEVQIFGSFATKLYLPDGDIDIAVLVQTNDEKNIYQAIYNDLLKKKQIYNEIEYIRKSKVPLIKFTKKQGNIQFDISVNKQDGIKQLAEVKKMGEYYPEFKYLFMVLKCMLKVRNLAQTYSGGLGSFLLFCMLLAFLKEVHKKKKYYTLSQSLLRFMQFYSISHDWSKKRISTNGCFEDRRNFDDTNYFSFLSPQDSEHDIGKGAFKIRDVFGVFKNRFRMVLGKNFKKGESVLKELVNPNQQVFMYLK